MKKIMLTESQIEKLVMEMLDIDEMADKPHETKTWMPIFDQLNDYIIPRHLRDDKDVEKNVPSYVDKGGKYKAGKSVGKMIGQIRGCESALGFIQIAVLFPSSKGQTIAEFAEQHKEILSEIRKEYSYVVIMPETEKMSIELIRNKKSSDIINRENPNLNVDLQYKPSGESLSVEAKLNKSLNQILKYFFENDKVISHLHERLIPPIRIDFERSDRGYNEVNNQVIKKGYKNFYHFKSNFDFNDAVNDMFLHGKTDVEYLETHQRYQFNKVYSNWPEKRRGIEDPTAKKTPVYKLDKQGYTDKNFHIVGVSEFYLIGVMEPNDNKFTWIVQFDCRFGKRGENETNLEKFISLFPKITVREVVDFREERPFEAEEGKTVLENLDIKNGLITACKSVVQQILDIDVNKEKMLEFSDVTAKTAGIDVNNLFETVINKTIKQIKENEKRN